jgi:hypothetical protein
MNRARLFVAATLAGASLIGSDILAQTTKNPQEPAPTAPQFKSVLAGKKFDPPIKGQVEVEFTQPVTKRSKDLVVTTIKVRNAASGPIARLMVDETWFDKGGAVVAGGKGLLKAPLQPGEVQTITIETPYNAKMNSNSWNFSHANGTVKPKKVKALEEPKAPTPAPPKK